MCGLAAEVDAIMGAITVWSDQGEPETQLHLTRQNRGLCQTHKAPPDSAP